MGSLSLDRSIELMLVIRLAISLMTPIDHTFFNPLSQYSSRECRLIQPTLIGRYGETVISPYADIPKLGLEIKLLVENFLR